MQTAEDLAMEITETELREISGARAYDVFGTANFFNFVPFATAVEHLTTLGLERVRDHDEMLVSHFVEGIDRAMYRVTSPNDRSPQRSTLIFFSHNDRDKNRVIYETLVRANLHVGFRDGCLRLAPHLYNTVNDINRTLNALHDFG